MRLSWENDLVLFALLHIENFFLNFEKGLALRRLYCLGDWCVLWNIEILDRSVKWVSDIKTMYFFFHEESLEVLIV